MIKLKVSKHHLTQGCCPRPRSLPQQVGPVHAVHVDEVGQLVGQHVLRHGDVQRHQQPQEPRQPDGLLEDDAHRDAQAQVGKVARQGHLVFDVLLGRVYAQIVLQPVAGGALSAHVRPVAAAAGAGLVAVQTLEGAFLIDAELVSLAAVLLQAFVHIRAAHIRVHEPAIVADGAALGAPLRACATAGLVAWGAQELGVVLVGCVESLRAFRASYSRVAHIAVTLSIPLPGAVSLALPVPVARILGSSEAGITVLAVVACRTTVFNLFDAKPVVNVIG